MPILIIVLLMAFLSMFTVNMAPPSAAVNTSKAQAPVNKAFVGPPAPEVKKPEITVMIIDTGIDRTHPLLKPYFNQDIQSETNRIGSDYEDNHAHGTHVTGITLYGNKIKSINSGLDPVCKEVKIISCKYFDPKMPNTDNLKNSINCVKEATRLKVQFINYSGGGTDFSQEEFEAYKSYSETGGIVYVAAGNEHSDLRRYPYYPASYVMDYKLKNMYPVANIYDDGTNFSSGNTHPMILREVGVNILSALPHESYGIMSGTSMSSPMALHRALKQKCIDLYTKGEIDGK